MSSPPLPEHVRVDKDFVRGIADSNIDRFYENFIFFDKDFPSQLIDLFIYDQPTSNELNFSSHLLLKDYFREMSPYQKAEVNLNPNPLKLLVLSQGDDDITNRNDDQQIWDVGNT